MSERDVLESIARLVPPGSRVVTTSMPRNLRRSASKATCVDLPEPSPPSNVMKHPRIRNSA